MATQPEPGEAIDPTSDEDGASSGARRGRPDRGVAQHFVGRAAQLAVMAELLQMQCNVAIPEVDLGTDIFAFQDGRDEVVRIQVKACTSPTTYAQEAGYSARFSIPMRQLERDGGDPPLHYVLAVRRDGAWVDFLVIDRASLFEFYNGTKPFGSLDKTNETLSMRIGFRANKTTCSEVDLSSYRNAWHLLSPLKSRVTTAENLVASHPIVTARGTNTPPQPAADDPDVPGDGMGSEGAT